MGTIEYTDLAELLHQRNLNEIKDLLPRVGYSAPPPAVVSAGHDSVPPEAAAYLVHDNPRLHHLKGRYSRIDSAAVLHSIWTADYVSFDVPLRHFRADCAYMWQKRDRNLPIHYVCTYLYLREHSTRDILKSCTEDTLFGAYSLRFNDETLTRDRLDSVCEINFIRESLGITPASRFTLLDIGSGYGRLGYRISQCFPNSRVFCVDAIPESSFLCEFYLNFRGAGGVARMVPLDELSGRLKDEKIDIAVAINSWSECSRETISWWIEFLIDRRVPYLMVAGSGDFDGGRALLNVAGGKKRPTDFLDIILQGGYRRVGLVPKFQEATMQQFGISPTYYHLFAL